MKNPYAAASHLAPTLRAVPFLRTAADSDVITLTPQQREELTQISTRVRLPARKVIYRQDSTAEWVFAIAEGVVKSYRELRSGRRALSAFLLANDLFGLAEKGCYINTAQAIVPVTLYRISLSQLTVLLKHDSDLQSKFLAKVTHELRESQRRAILVSRRDAAGRLATFIALMAARAGQSPRRNPEVPLPMSRSDIAAFLGLTLESVSRAAAELQRKGLVKFESRHLVRILDASRLAKLVAAA